MFESTPVPLWTSANRYKLRTRFDLLALRTPSSAPSSSQFEEWTAGQFPRSPLGDVGKMWFKSSKVLSPECIDTAGPELRTEAQSGCHPAPVASTFQRDGGN